MTVLLAVGVFAMTQSAGAALMVGYVDDFQTDLANWEGGTPAQHVTSGGPDGDGDGYLRLTAEGRNLGTVAGGLPGAGGQSVNPWQADYLEAGITGISLDLNNFGPEPVTIRLMIEASGLGNWTSTDGVTLQPGSGWQTAVFGLTEEAMTRVKGSAPLSAMLADITKVHFRHDGGAPDAPGIPNPVTASLGIDNATAVPEPAALALLALGGLTLIRRRGK